MKSQIVAHQTPRYAPGSGFWYRCALSPGAGTRMPPLPFPGCPSCLAPRYGKRGSKGSAGRTGRPYGKQFVEFNDPSAVARRYPGNAETASSAQRKRARYAKRPMLTEAANDAGQQKLAMRYIRCTIRQVVKCVGELHGWLERLAMASEGVWDSEMTGEVGVIDVLLTYAMCQHSRRQKCEVRPT